MTARRTALIAAASALVGGAVGWQAAQWRSTADAASSGTVRGTTAISDSDTGVGTATDAHAPERALEDDLGQASRRAAGDPAYLQQLTREYATSPGNVDRRGALLSIIGNVHNEESLRFASQLAASNDPAERRDGLRLLAGFPLDQPAARDAVIAQLRDARDPALTAQLLRDLAPPQMAAEDAAPILSELARLRGSADPAVRAASVLQSVHWDKSADAGALLQDALLDEAPEVRAAAIAGVQSARARNPLIRDALLAIAGNPQSGTEERQAAVLALQDFALGRDDYAIYQRAADSLPRD